jgi:hypothetical protein
MFYSYLEFQAMDKVRNPRNSESGRSLVTFRKNKRAKKYRVADCLAHSSIRNIGGSAYLRNVGELAQDYAASHLGCSHGCENLRQRVTITRAAFSQLSPSVMKQITQFLYLH